MEIDHLVVCGCPRNTEMRAAVRVQECSEFARVIGNFRNRGNIN